MRVSISARSPWASELAATVIMDLSTPLGPGLALKLIHRERSGPPSIARQVAGYRLLEPFPAEIPTVKIVASHCGNGEEACYLVVENLHHGRWADRGVVVAPSVLGERERAAARRLYDNPAARRIVAVDCHRDNLFFFAGSAGDLTAGILDHDYIFDLERYLEYKSGGTPLHP
jgi:hypothetical protein